MKSIAALIAIASFSLTAFANPPAAAGAPPGHPAAGPAGHPTAGPAGHPTAGPADMGKAEVAVTKKGKVISTVDTKSFTYIEIQDGNKKLWIVSPTIAVKAGSMISYADAPLQAKYHSPSLNRDFTDIVFTTRVVIDK